MQEYPPMHVESDVRHGIVPEQEPVLADSHTTEPTFRPDTFNPDTDPKWTVAELDPNDPAVPGYLASLALDGAAESAPDDTLTGPVGTTITSNGTRVFKLPPPVAPGPDGSVTVDELDPAVYMAGDVPEMTIAPVHNDGLPKLADVYLKFVPPMAPGCMAEAISTLVSGDVVRAVFADSSMSTVPMVVTGSVSVIGSNVFFPLSIYLRGTTGALHSHLMYVEVLDRAELREEPMDLGAVVEADDGELYTRFSMTDPAWIDADGRKKTWAEMHHPRHIRRPIGEAS